VSNDEYLQPPIHVSNRPRLRSTPGKAVTFDADQWLSVLEMAHKYDMAGIREIAIQELKNMNLPLPPVKQLVFARRYHCDELVDPPFQALVARKETLSKDEMAQLPLDDLHRLIVAREKPFLKLMEERRCNKCHLNGRWHLKCWNCGQLEAAPY